MSDQQGFLPGVVGFYLGIGTSSLGGAVAATGWILLRDSPSRQPVLIVGCAMMVVGFLAALHFLKAARKHWK